MTEFAKSWHKCLATELQSICRADGVNVRRQHALEIIAACFGKVSAALFPGEDFATHTPEIPSDVDWVYVARRLERLDPDLSEDDIGVVLSALEQIWDEESDESLAIVKRLVRNIASNCAFHESGQYSGCVWLPEQDWEFCGETMGRVDFVDMLFESLPWPSIVPIASAKPQPHYDNLYQVEPGCILNLIAFLSPDQHEQFLRRYFKALI